MDTCGTTRMSRSLSASAIPPAWQLWWARKAGCRHQPAQCHTHRLPNRVLLRCGGTRFPLWEMFPSPLSPCGHCDLTHSALPALRATRNPVQAPRHTGQCLQEGEAGGVGMSKGNPAWQASPDQPHHTAPSKTSGESAICKASATLPTWRDQMQLLLEGFGSTAQASRVVPTTRPPHQDLGKPLSTSRAITAQGRFLHLSLKQLVLPDMEDTLIRLCICM